MPRCVSGITFIRYPYIQVIGKHSNLKLFGSRQKRDSQNLIKLRLSEGDENVCLKEMRTFAASKPMAHKQDSQNMVKLRLSEGDENVCSK